MGRIHWVIVVIQKSQCGGMRYKLWLDCSISFGFFSWTIAQSFRVLGHDVFLLLKFANNGRLTGHFFGQSNCFALSAFF